MSPHLLVSDTEGRTFNKPNSKNVVIRKTQNHYEFIIRHIGIYRNQKSCQHKNVPRFGDGKRVFSVVECVMVNAGSPKVFTATRAGQA